MNAIKVNLRKSKKDAVCIDNKYTVIKEENGFNVLSYPTGVASNDQNGIEPFVEHFKNWLILQEEIKNERIQAEIQKEKDRISEIEKKIKECSSGYDLKQVFGLSSVETASHWSDLHEGRSSFAILISSAEEFEIIELAKDLLDFKGDFNEAKHRAGEHHNTLNGGHYRDMSHYKESCVRHFNGNDYYYKSKETESESIMEQIHNIDSSEEDAMEQVRSLLDKFDSLEDGYYDCNGNLEISDKQLDSKDFTGYSEDVYSYNLCFAFESKEDYYNEYEEGEEETAE